MTLRRSDQYVEELKKQRREVYIFGEKTDDFVSHPAIVPSINAMRLTFDLATTSKYEDVMTTKSHLTGETINRFTQIHLSTEDHRKRVEQNQELMKLHGSCVGGRCVGNDTINSVYSVTYDMDKELGTDYHERFKKWLKDVQTRDLVVSGMVTDVKGDRSKSPSKQQDPDLYVRVVDRRADGIVIRGAKAHQSGAVIADYHLLAPTTALREDDKDYALACATKADSEGIKHIYEWPIGNIKWLFDDLDIDLGNSRFGVHGSSLVIFDDVFVPWEQVFMCGEWQFTSILVERFANLHRAVYTMCHATLSELCIGAAAAIAEYNGLDWRRITHIREKITDMLHEAALSKGALMGAIALGRANPAGSIDPDPVLVNAAKLQAVKAQIECCKLLTDIAGGLVGTLPSERDLKNPDTAKYLEKYLKGANGVSVEDRMRMFRFIEYLIGQSSLMIPVTLHAGGSPETQRVFIRMRTDVDELIKQAKRLARVKEKA